MDLRARDIMTPRSECIVDSDTLREAGKLLVKLRAADQPVLIDGNGVSSLARFELIGAVAEGRHPAETRVGELPAFETKAAASRVMTVAGDCPLDQMRSAMYGGGATALVVEEQGDVVGVVTFKDLEDALYRAPDGLPLPPLDLIQLVGGPQARRRNNQNFYSGGLQSADNIRGILRRQGIELNDLNAVLDFGCGCGRVMRHWAGLTGPRLYGSDYQSSPVDWCRAHLPFAEFAVNDSKPPLPYADGTFDFVYALSVFTHLAEEWQTPWIEELRRVLGPRGLLLITVQGSRGVGQLEPEQRDAFLAGELVVLRPESSGADECAAIHPEDYIYETLAAGLEVLEFVPGGAPEMGQSTVLFRNP